MKTFQLNYIVFAAALALSACTGSQKLDRSQVPVAGPAPKIQLGDYQTFSLENGLKVIVVENHKLPRVSYQLSIDNDPMMEGPKAGVSQLTGDLLKAGTQNRSKAEIDEAVDFIGGSLSTSANGVFASSLKKHSNTLLDIFSDVLNNPSFPADELEKSRKQYLSGLASAKTSANEISANIVNIINFGNDHPYGEVQREETISAVSREDLINYYKTYFRPNVAYLVIVGDITVDEAKAQAQKYFGSWQKAAVPKHVYPRPEAPAGNRVCFVPLQGAVQSVIDVTYPVNLTPGAQDAIPASVMNSILGGGVFSGRLMQNLREDKAFTYGARSSLNPDKLVGSFSANASVRNEVTDSSIVEILFEMDRMTKEFVPDSTIQFVKNSMNGSFARSLESPQTIARFALNIERYGLPKDYYATYLEKLAAVNAQSVMAMAQKYVKPNNANITVVGNREEVADKLARFAASGKVELLDMFGEEYKDMRPAPAGITAQTVLDNYVKAIGGIEKLKSVKSVSQKGTFAVGPMVLEVIQKSKNNNKLLLTIGQPGLQMVKQVFDGKNASSSQMGQKQELDEAQINTMKMQSDLLAETHLDVYGITCELKGIDKLDGKEVYVLEIKQKDGKVSTDYFDVTTGLRLQSVSSESSPMGDLVSTTLIKSYITVDGISFPSEITQSVGPQVIEMKMTEVKLNENIADSEFKVE
jgi:zinc protease